MAHSSAAAARWRRAAGPAPSLTGPASDVHPVLRRTSAPPAALDLLAQARSGLEEAAVLETPNERYATAHLAALRAAAAVLAARGRPETTPRARARIRSAWEVLPEIAPELSDWSALFASGAPRRARAEAGIRGAANRRDADDLIREVAVFLRLVERMLALQPVLPQPRPDTDQPATDRLDTAGPGAAGSGFDGPGSAGSGFDGPGSVGSGFDGPGSAGPGVDGPGSAGSDFDGPGSAGSGPTRPRGARPDSGHPDADRSGSGRGRFDRSGAGRPGFDRPGFDHRGRDRPGRDRPGAGPPGDGRTGRHLPDAG